MIETDSGRSVNAANQPTLRKAVPMRLGAITLLSIAAILIGYSIHWPALLVLAIVLLVFSALLRRKAAFFLLLRGNWEDRDFSLLTAATNAALYADGLWLKNLQGRSLPFPTIPLGGLFVNLVVLTNFFFVYVVFDVGWSENWGFQRPTLAFSFLSAFAFAWIASRRWIMTALVFFSSTLLLTRAEQLHWRDSLVFLESAVVFWTVLGVAGFVFIASLCLHAFREGPRQPKILGVDRLLATRFMIGSTMIVTGLIYTRPWTEDYAEISIEVIWLFLLLCSARLGGELVRIIKREPIGRIAITDEDSLERVIRMIDSRRTFIGALRLFDPAPVIEINTPLEVGSLWRTVIERLSSHVNFVILDVTAFADREIDLSRGLAWELLHCANTGVFLVLVCDKKKVEQATAQLKRTFGDIVFNIVPLDGSKRHHAELVKIIEVASSATPVMARSVPSKK